MKTIPKLILIALAAGALPGCSVLGVGEENFACSGMPGSVYCSSARDVYKKTNDGTVPSPMAPGDAYNEDCDDCVKAEDVNPALRDQADYDPTKPAAAAAEPVAGIPGSAEGYTVARSGDEVIDNYVAPNLPTKPVPVRTPAQVMRIWVAPYVDTNGDLQAPGYLYTEIEPRRWIYPDDTSFDSHAYLPLSSAGIGSAGAGGVRHGVSAGKTPEENSLERYKQSQRAK